MCIMPAMIRAYEPADRAAALDLVLATWDPVFEGMRASLPGYVYNAFYPNGWEQRQLADVGALLDEAQGRSWVAVEDDQVVGLLIAAAHEEDTMGEIVLVGTLPGHQKKGIAAALTDAAYGWMRDQGMTFAMAETLEDDGHAPARAAYEGLGFEKWSVARFVKPL